MASSLKYVRVPPNSANMAEARQRVFEFFKTACRSVPTIMDIYNLDDVASPSLLRSIISSEIRKNADVTNTKGTEELHNIVEHAKQRHHILGQYILVGSEGVNQDVGAKDQGASDFLKNFYKGNYF